MPSKTATRRQQRAARRIAKNTTDHDALRESIISQSKAAQIARRLAAQTMGLVNDPEGLNLPKDIWEQKMEEAREALRKAAQA